MTSYLTPKGVGAVTAGIVALGAVGVYWYRSNILVWGINKYIQEAKPKNSTGSFRLQDGNAVITFERAGTQWTMTLPHDRRKIARHAETRVFLVKHDDNSADLEITHYPGLPYLATARQLGGIGYRVCREGKEIWFGPDEMIDLDQAQR